MTLTTTLAEAGFRLTDPRLAIAELIGRRRGHFTAAELLAEARARRMRVGRASVFRTLDLFAELGALERLDLPTGEHAYVACRPTHHHHVVCRNCGRTADVPDADLAAAVAEMSAQTGFTIDDHRLELFGLCPECRP